jgi:hypothetical protein
MMMTTTTTLRVARDVDARLNNAILTFEPIDEPIQEADPEWRRSWEEL